MTTLRGALIALAVGLAAGLCRAGEEKPGPAFGDPPPPKGWVSRPRVLVVIYDPVIEAEGGKKLTKVLGWNDPDGLAKQYAADVREASSGTVRYKVAERVERDEWPPLADGFRYTDESFLAMWRGERKFRPG
ncbi:MAG: hypothetical protein MUC63_03585, partial [Planctomycetes bacterium]|nr:hypothetical protein [Planctomycetota bacterium]